MKYNVTLTKWSGFGVSVTTDLYGYTTRWMTDEVFDWCRANLNSGDWTVDYKSVLSFKYGEDFLAAKLKFGL